LPFSGSPFAKPLQPNMTIYAMLNKILFPISFKVLRFDNIQVYLFGCGFVVKGIILILEKSMLV
jgi:hypothetical protein